MPEGSVSLDTRRVVVFIDYQNMYRRARGAFGWENDGSPGYLGNFKPLALARLLAQGEGRELKQVRVYTGMPTQEHDKKGYEIMQRRTQAWENADPVLVDLHGRSMKYPRPSARRECPECGRKPEPHEKGVDVELAVDFVALALDEEYDVGIVASADTDIIPAIELVARRFDGIEIETVAWTPDEGCEAPEPLDIQQGGLTRRRLNHADFNRIVDETNYVRAAQDSGPAPGQSGRRLPRNRRKSN